MKANSFIFIIMVPVFLTILSACSGGSAGIRGEAATPGSCDVVGNWVGQVPAGMMAGRVLRMQFNADGTATGTCSNVTLNSTWQRQGNLVQVVGVNANPPFAGCDPTIVGQYTLQFSADCRNVVSISGEDACGHRRDALLNFQARRQ